VPAQNYEELLCRSLRTETLRYMSSDTEKRPEADSARNTVRQLPELAKKEGSEAGDMFIRAYESVFTF